MAERLRFCVGAGVWLFELAVEWSDGSFVDAGGDPDELGTALSCFMS